VDDCAWIFARGEERLEVRRLPTDDGVLLVIVENGEARTHRFPDLAALVPVQSDMERFFLRAGWSLVEFWPEKRGYRDRRRTPRLSERRRWWTDARNVVTRTLSSRNRR
jgi:hypothetical protein